MTATLPQPTSNNAAATRRLVFISHANPEENDFARWLGSQLASAGYEIWSDIVKLIGGEVFWDNIEDAIRNHSAKVVLAVSRASNTKAGVQDEAAVAIGVERKQQIPNFVVPIRLDDIDFGDFRANITRKNAIDFSKNWAAGLATLLKVLERDAVPRGKVGPADVRAWCESRFDTEQRPKAETEVMVSNWLPIANLPSHVTLFSLGVEATKVPGLMKSTTLPWFPYFRLVGTFGTQVDLMNDLPMELEIEQSYCLPTALFLQGGTRELPGMNARTARNHVSSLVRQAWNRTLRQRGLSPFEMANGSVVWFFTKDQIEGDRAYFVDRTGKRRRRLVVGRSERRQVYWHLGFQAKAVMGLTPRIALRAAILFSEDGKTPLASVEKMHKLRRGFCRSWWNQHWRDLLLTYVAWLADENGDIVLDAGIGADLRLRADPICFDSPISFPDPRVKGNAAPAGEEEAPPDEPAHPVDDYDPNDNEWDEGGEE